MKKLAIFVCALALVAFSTSSKPKTVNRTVVYGSSVDCKNCEKKVMENILSLKEKTIVMISHHEYDPSCFKR